MQITPVSERPQLLDQVRKKLHMNQYAIRTEEKYLYWIKRFILFHGKPCPKDMGAEQFA
jgi:Phage integrase, N-terminal SAM-like domain